MHAARAIARMAKGGAFVQPLQLLLHGAEAVPLLAAKAAAICVRKVGEHACYAKGVVRVGYGANFVYRIGSQLRGISRKADAVHAGVQLNVYVQHRAASFGGCVQGSGIFLGI